MQCFVSSNLQEPGLIMYVFTFAVTWEGLVGNIDIES